MDNIVLKHFPEIKHVSASSLNKWNGEYSDEGLWCLSYLFGKKFKGSEATIRGDIVETCLLKVLTKKDKGILDFAKRSFKERCELLDDITEKKYNKEYDALEGFVDQCYIAVKELQLRLPDGGKVTQSKIVHMDERFPLPIVGYVDFDFGSYAMDLKTTHAVPSSDIKQDHKRQIGLYAKARKDREAKILYISSKKYKRFSLYDREIDSAYDQLIFRYQSLFQRLEAAALLAEHKKTNAKEEFVKIVTPNTSSWAWGEEEMLFAAENNLWSINKSS